MTLGDIYGPYADKTLFRSRVNKLTEIYKEKVHKVPEYVFSSSGRAEICGNHTDHNHGKVIVAAISCDILAAVGKSEDGVIRIYSEGFAPFCVNVDETEVVRAEYGKSVALVRGVVKAIKDRGYKVGGFTAVSDSTVFRGAGVSSSAAFELLIAEILNVLYLDGALGKVEKAIISQYAENIYFGKPCGLLDQSGISLGGINKIDFKDPESPVIESLSAPEGYTLVITNTGGSHATLTEHYAAIKSEMHDVARCFGKEFLRDVGEDEFYDSISSVRRKTSDRAVLRACHFYEENKRVEVGAIALRRGDIRTFLESIQKSGESSLNCLQNCFVPGSCEQPVSLALHISDRIIKDGAVRLHGGGFAGTILAYLSDAEKDGYAFEMAKLFGEENVFKASVRKPGAVCLDVRALSE